MLISVRSLKRLVNEASSREMWTTFASADEASDAIAGLMPPGFELASTFDDSMHRKSLTFNVDDSVLTELSSVRADDIKIMRKAAVAGDVLMVPVAVRKAFRLILRAIDEEIATVLGNELHLKKLKSYFWSRRNCDVYVHHGFDGTDGGYTVRVTVIIHPKSESEHSSS